LIGYDRYDTQTAVEAMNALYVDAGLLQDLFVPSVKLVGKTRVGSRTRRRYDAPQTMGAEPPYGARCAGPVHERHGSSTNPLRDGRPSAGV
jgi:hypothetical protein